MIVRPALAVPTTVFIRERFVAFAENTINKRSPAIIGCEIVLDKPLLMLPMVTIPVSDGVRVRTAAVGLKMLLPADARYTWAVIVRVDPIRDNAAVVVKEAAIPVIVPFRGTVKE